MNGIDISEMRDATKEERESVQRYIESISREKQMNDKEHFNAFTVDELENVIKNALAVLIKKQYAQGYKDGFEDGKRAMSDKEIVEGRL